MGSNKSKPLDNTWSITGQAISAALSGLKPTLFFLGKCGEFMSKISNWMIATELVHETSNVLHFVDYCSLGVSLLAIVVNHYQSKANGQLKEQLEKIDEVLGINQDGKTDIELFNESINGHYRAIKRFSVEIEPNLKKLKELQ